MKTRTLLLLSVGTALMILLAGGVLLLQLAGQDEVVEPTDVGETVSIGDLSMTVLGSEESSDRFSVDVEFGGVDGDLDGIDLVTGDRVLAPLVGADEGRCRAITVETRTCRLDFDTSGVESSNRTMLVVRGDDQQNWQLAN